MIGQRADSTLIARYESSIPKRKKEKLERLEDSGKKSP